MRQYEQSPVKYDADALEFQHAREIKQRQKVKRKSSLKTYKVSHSTGSVYVAVIRLKTVSGIEFKEQPWLHVPTFTQRAWVRVELLVVSEKGTQSKLLPCI